MTLIGKYEKKDGTRFDVRIEKKILERANEKDFGNRPYFPVTEEEPRQEIKNGYIKKIEE